MKKTIGIMIGIIGCLTAICGIIFKAKEKFSVTIIGGADGPTSVFVAGKVGGDISASIIIVGVILVIVGVIIGVRKKK